MVDEMMEIRCVRMGDERFLWNREMMLFVMMVVLFTAAGEIDRGGGGEESGKPPGSSERARTPHCAARMYAYSGLL